MLSLLGMIYLGTLPKQAIHVIEVDKLGRAVYAGRAGTSGAQYKINQASKKFHLKRFIENVRSLPSDAIVVKHQWEDAYALLSPNAANVLSQYARKVIPTERLKKERVAIDNVTLIPISDNSWSAEWNETSWNTKGGNNGYNWPSMVQDKNGTYKYEISSRDGMFLKQEPQHIRCYFSEIPVQFVMNIIVNKYVVGIIIIMIIVILWTMRKKHNKARGQK